jgi:DNA-binding FadR family transcriptional regulator
MPASFSSVKRERLYEDVARQLVSTIVAGEVPEGSFLPSEPRLIAEFGASRTVIREALKVIAAKNLAEVEHGLGTRVNPSSEWNIFDPDVIAALARNAPLMRRLLHDLFAIRWMLEPQIARAAALEREAEEIERMRGLVEAMEGLVDDDRPFFEQDVRFHRALLVASHNVVLERMFDPIQELLRTSKLQVVTVTSADSRRESNRGHAAVLDAVERRDPDAAEREMRDHLKLTARELELAEQTVLRAEPGDTLGGTHGRR